MIPRKLAACLDKPGQYLFIGGSYPFFVEINEKQEVFQLTPRLKRSGILSADGWNPSPATLAARLYRLEEVLDADDSSL